jgi:hypothetical protein
MLSGVQLLAIGIIGEYLARIFLKTQRRPTYVLSNYPPHTSTADQ